MDLRRVFVRTPSPGRSRGWIVSALFVPALLLLPAIALAQGTVQGTVAGEGGDPLIGAQVQIEGTNMGAVTDRDGRYTIGGVPPGTHTIHVIYLGYRERRSQMNISAGTNVANFRLQRTPVELERIVVTGTAGQVSKRSLGNSIATLDTDELLQKAPVTNLHELISGRTAGAVVLPNSGSAGTGSGIRLRGVGSITQSNEPLLYVDGVRIDNDATAGASVFSVGGQIPSRINDLTLEDIESIEIIKGPAAATLYGTEASNGVIQVVTKKGRSGETRWNARATLGRTDLDQYDYPFNWSTIPGGADLPDGPGVSVDRVLEDGSQLIKQAPIPEFIESGNIQDYNISASGGRDNFTFYTSGLYLFEDGTLPANWQERIGARANFQWTPSDVWDVAISTGYINNDIRLPNNDNNIFGYFGNALLGRPGRIRVTGDGRNFQFGEPFTPIEDVHFLNSHWTNDRFTGSMTANYNPRPWFRNRAIFGFDGNWEENWQFLPFGAVTNLNPKGQKDNNRQTVTTITFDYNGTVIWDASDDLRFNSSFGTQVFNQNTDIVSAEGEDFPAPGVETVSAAGVTMGEESREENTTLGFYLQEQMAWRNRLFLTAAIRFDDNSAFGKDFSAEKYPKFSASWVISEEPWWNWGFVNALKLRGAWGKAGQQPAAFSADRTLEAVAVKAGTPTVSTDQVGNPDLGPETSSEIEIGFDAGMWNDRIGLEITYYDKTTEDALIAKRIPPSTGFGGTQLFNVGELTNSGWEIGLNGLLVDTEMVDYSFSFNYTSNENEVTSLGGEAGFATANGFDQRVEEGFPVDGLWGRMPTIEADGSVTLSDEKEFYGRVTPGNYGTWGSTITLWDNLQIYSLLEWKKDIWAHNTTEEFRWIFASMRERWDPDLTDSDYANIVGALVGNGEPVVENADFWKWRELSFTWTMPDSWAQMLRSRRATITFSGRNLKTWSDYRGIDPESNFAGADDLIFEDFLTVPQARRWLITTNLTF